MASDAQSLQAHWAILDEWRRDYGHEEPDLDGRGMDERSRYGSYVPASALELKMAPPPSGLRKEAA